VNRPVKSYVSGERRKGVNWGSDKEEDRWGEGKTIGTCFDIKMGRKTSFALFSSVIKSRNRVKKEGLKEIN